jgi:hypothetical protein
VTSQEPENQHSADSGNPDTEVLMVASPVPVFVDESGRRRKLLRRVAYGFGAVCMLYGGLVSVSLAGGPVSSSVVLPLPDLGDDDDDAVQVAPKPPVPGPIPAPTTRSPRLLTEALRRPATPSTRDTRRAEAPRATSSVVVPGPKPPTRVSPSPSKSPAPVESGTVSPSPTPSGSSSASPSTPVSGPTTQAPPVPPKQPSTGGAGGGAVDVGSETGTKAPPPAPPVRTPDPKPATTSDPKPAPVPDRVIVTRTSPPLVDVGEGA